MKENFIKEKTCAFTGHRILREDFDKKLLASVIREVIDLGYDTFLCGMAIGFDSECFRCLEEIRKEKNIRIVACIPCLSQSYKYNYKQKAEYDRMLKNADEKIVVTEEYTPYCMQKRNAFMVDNSSLIISYLRTEKGGTFNTVKYAKSKGVKVVRI